MIAERITLAVDGWAAVIAIALAAVWLAVLAVRGVVVHLRYDDDYDDEEDPT